MVLLEVFELYRQEHFIVKWGNGSPGGFNKNAAMQLCRT